MICVHRSPPNWHQSYVHVFIKSCYTFSKRTDSEPWNVQYFWFVKTDRIHNMQKPTKFELKYIFSFVLRHSSNCKLFKSFVRFCRNFDSNKNIYYRITASACTVKPDTHEIVKPGIFVLNRILVRFWYKRNYTESSLPLIVCIQVKCLKVSKSVKVVGNVFAIKYSIKLEALHLKTSIINSDTANWLRTKDQRLIP